MEKKYQVGTSIEINDEEWIIAVRHENGEWIDLELFHKETGRRGDLRVKNI